MAGDSYQIKRVWNVFLKCEAVKIAFLGVSVMSMAIDDEMKCSIREEKGVFYCKESFTASYFDT